MDLADRADERPVCYYCPRPVRPPATLCDACTAATDWADRDKPADDPQLTLGEGAA